MSEYISGISIDGNEFKFIDFYETTDNYDLSRVIVACACYDSNGDAREFPDWQRMNLHLGGGGYGDPLHGILEIEAIESGEMYLLKDGYNHIYWDCVGLYTDIYVVYANGKELNSDVIEFGWTKAVGTQTSYALLQALSKGIGIVKTDNPNVLSQVILACYAESIDEYGVGVDITDIPWVVYEDRDENNNCVGLRLKQTDTGDEYYIENGGYDFELNDGSAYIYIYVDLDVLSEQGEYVDGVNFKFTKTTQEIWQYSLWRVLSRTKDMTEVDSATHDITDNREVNKIILAATIMNDESVYIDEVPTLDYTIKVKSSKEFILTDDDDNTYTLKEGLNYIYLLDGVNDGNTLILLIDFNCVKFGDININDEFKFHFTPTISKTTTRSIINSIERSNGCATTDWRVNNVILSMYEYSGEKFWLHIFYDGEDDKFEVSIERDRTGDVIKCVDGLNKIEFPFRSNASGLTVYLYIDLDGGYVIDRIGPNDSLRIPFYAKDRYNNLKLNRVMWEMIRSLTSRIEVLESKIQQTEK